MTQQPSFHDIENLSAYLDDQLSTAERARLAARLASDARLQAILVELRQARALLKHTPSQRIPRNFTLTPKMVGMRIPLPRSVPVFRLASLTAAVMLFLSFALNFLSPFAAAPNLAAAPLQSSGDVAQAPPGYGYGGGPQETATPGQVTAMSIAPLVGGTITPEPTPEAGMRTMEQPTQAAKIAPTEIVPLKSFPNNAKIDQTQPLFDSLQIGLIFLFLACGAIALLIRQITILRWRKRQ